MTEKNPLSLVELLDLIFVPTSAYRLYEKGKLNLDCGEPKEEFRESKFVQIHTKISPYIDIVCLEGIRLCSYGLLIKQIVENYS